MKKRPGVVRDQVVVYLDARDRALLDDMARETGLSRTELFRRGLRRLAAEGGDAKPGFSLAYLVATARQDEFPPDVAERADDYLYGARYQRSKKRKRARPR